MTAMQDVLPKVIVELRSNEAVAAIVHGRVASPKAAPGWADFDDFDNGTRKYKHAFIVVGRLTSPRRRRVPVQDPRFVIGCYGRTVAEAAELRWAASNALHMTGPRVYPSGLGIYTSFEDTGGDPDSDPDTGQPLERFIVQAIATTQAVA